MESLRTKKGLLVKRKWGEMHLDGSKPWEIRGSDTKIRGKIYLCFSGTGMIHGELELTGTKKLTAEEFKNSKAYHHIPTDDLPYKNTWAWITKNPVKYETPEPYKHPQGAVIWVNL